METYKQIYSYPPLRLQAAELKGYQAEHPIKTMYPIVDSSSLFGIEVEVENIRNSVNPGPFWSITEDGSLRNHGREFISRPIKANQVEYALRSLFEQLYNTNDPVFSERCSVHVHCNIRTMTPDQLWGMMMTYLCFEKVLFRFIGQNRDKNIHCVPIGDSTILKQIAPIIRCHLPPRHWLKYTAVNLVPMTGMGTVEFRHMHGTSDIGKLMHWINCILRMKLFAYKNTNDYVQNSIYSLNSNSQYRSFAFEVFGEYAEELVGDLDYIQFQELMEDNVTLAKHVFTEQIGPLTVSPSSKVAKIYGVSSGYSKRVVSFSEILSQWGTDTGTISSEVTGLASAQANPITPPAPPTSYDF